MTRPRLRLIVVALLAALGAMPVGGQARRPPSPDQEPLPTFRSAAEAVQLTAIVTDASGGLVSGLTQNDFEIVENGTPQPITTFSAVDIPIERTDRSGGEPDVLGNDGPEGRVYLIALDEVAPENALRTRHFLRQFIDEYFGPNDTAAIVLLGRGLRTDGQEFTGNPRLLLTAIDKFSGGFGDDPMRQRNLMGSFKDLTEFLAKVQRRRKALIFVSEGIGADAYDLVDYNGGVLSIAGEDFQQAVSAATRSNVSIYPVDPRGLSPDVSGPGVGNDLRALAEVTGGFALTNSNGFKATFERIVRENSTYYVIGFNSSYEKQDARWVPVGVRVRRPGLRVQSVNGYVAPRAQPNRARTEAPRTANTVLPAVWDAVASPLTTAGIPMRVFAAPFKGKDRNATVAITLEIAAGKLNLVQSNGAHRGELEIVFAISDSRKRKWRPIRHRATVALKPETYEKVSRGALRVISQLSLPEGHYQVRVSAGGAALAGSVVYDMDIPDFKDDFSMSGIALTSTHAKDTITVSPYARLDVPLPAAPTTAREFTRDDAVQLFMEAYENRRKPHTVDFTAELRDGAGRTVGADALQRKGLDKPKGASVYSFSPTLTLGALSPGRYTIHVEARSSLDGKKSLTRSIPISVR